MHVLGRILRTISLAMLFGGSVAIVFGAIVLIHAAKAKGIPVAEAAATNAPLFIVFSKVNLAFGILLLIGEALDYADRRLWNKATIAQYACSLLCVASTMVFAIGIVPPMERLLPLLGTEHAEKAREEFRVMHEVSRPIFGTTIILALFSLILPIFGALKETPVSTEAESA